MHRFYDDRLQQLMTQYIDRINHEEQDHIAALNAAIPFAQRPADPAVQPKEKGDSHGIAPSV
jgi:hypothetical protein